MLIAAGRAGAVSSPTGPRTKLLHRNFSGQFSSPRTSCLQQIFPRFWPHASLELLTEGLASLLPSLLPMKHTIESQPRTHSPIPKPERGFVGDCWALNYPGTWSCAGFPFQIHYSLWGWDSPSSPLHLASVCSEVESSGCYGERP